MRGRREGGIDRDEREWSVVLPTVEKKPYKTVTYVTVTYVTKKMLRRDYFPKKLSKQLRLKQTALLTTNRKLGTISTGHTVISWKSQTGHINYVPRL